MSVSSYPVLMYHKVGCPVQCERDNFLNISARSFRRQMQVMARLGYRARPFSEIVQAIASNETLPPRTFAITFDDGYRCVGETAAPILKEFGFVATVFIVSDCVGTTNQWDRALGHPEVPLLSWDELRHLARAGWEMAGHTRAHRHLGALDDEAALREIAEGKRETEAQIGQTLQTFCYPFGHFNERTASLVRSAGFQGACTTQSGLARAGGDPFLLPRVKVTREGVSNLLFRLLIRSRLRKNAPENAPTNRNGSLRANGKAREPI